MHLRRPVHNGENSRPNGRAYLLSGLNCKPDTHKLHQVQSPGDVSPAVLMETSHGKEFVTFKRRRKGSRDGFAKWSEFTIYYCAESGACADVETNAIDCKAALEPEISQMEDYIAEMHSVCRTAVDRGLYIVIQINIRPRSPVWAELSGPSCWLGRPDQCIGMVPTPDTAASMPRNFESGKIIRPTTLDSCFQSALLALKSIDLEFSTLYVPTYNKIGPIFHGIPKEPGYEFNICTTVRMSESGNELDNKYPVTHACGQDKQPMIEINDFISSALSSSDHRILTTSIVSLCFSM